MRRHEGFTLLELLVVIITLGILSVVMTLSIKTMSTTADANNVINNMLMLKNAALAWYKENLSRMVIDSQGGCKIKTKGIEQTFGEFVQTNSGDILQYLDNTSSLILRSATKKPNTNNTGDYTLQAMNSNKQWYVCYNAGTTSYTITKYGEEAPALEIKQKLAGRAAKLGLQGTNDDKDNVLGQFNAQKHKFVCMLILDFSK